MLGANLFYLGNSLAQKLENFLSFIRVFYWALGKSSNPLQDCLLLSANISEPNCSLYVGNSCLAQ